MFFDGCIVEVDSENRLRLAAREAFDFQRMRRRNPRQRTPSSRLQTGVLPVLTTYFGPRTECAGFDGVICRTTRKSYSIRTAASFSLTVGLDPGKSSIQAATWNGRTDVSSRP